MRDIYLGDSYDIVKRFWANLLNPISPLYSHTRFVPKTIWEIYEKMTGIPVTESPPSESFGLLLDPDTGIPLPESRGENATAKHAPLQYIVHLMRDWQPRYMVIFDQSYHRKHRLIREEQRAAKMQFLAVEEIQSFYYVSHAPFLICSNVEGILSQIRDALVAAGLPESRLEKGD